MRCKSIADVLRSLEASCGDASSFPDQSGNEPQAIEIVSDPPVSSWLDVTKIAAANAPDVIERLERGMDDRTFEQRSADGSRGNAVARLSRPPKFNFGAQVKAKSATPKVKAARPRTDETRAYFREYQRRRRAEARAAE